MKKLLLLLLFTISCFSQAPSIQWQKSFGGSGTDNVYQLKQTSDLGYITIGDSNSNTGDLSGNHGGYDVLVVKMDANGNQQWLKLFGGSADDRGRCILQTPDGGYIIGGHTYSNNGDVTLNRGFDDIWIIKLDSAGEIQWQKTIGGSQSDTLGSLVQTSDGGYIAAGFSNSQNGDHDVNSILGVWILKLSSDATIQWQKSYTNGVNINNEQRIRQTADNGYIVAFTSAYLSPTSSYDIYIKKLDSLGNIQFQKSYGGSFQEDFTDVIQTDDLGFLIVASARSNDFDISGHHGTAGSSSDVWVCKLNSLGIIQWQKSLGSTGADNGGIAKQTPDGGYIIAASASANNGDVTQTLGGPDAWIVKLNNAGTLLWQKSYGGNGLDKPADIQLTNDNSYIFSGMTNSNNGDITQSFGLADFWTVKLGPELSIDDFKQKKIIISPNPTTTLLDITIADDISFDKIVILDFTGKTILVQTENNNQIDTSNLSNGLYFLEVFSGEDKYQTKFIKK